jgi:hypothetical protein
MRERSIFYLNHSPPEIPDLSPKTAESAMIAANS